MERLTGDVDLYGIAYGCPKKVREKDCPFLEIEHLSFKEKVIWIDELSVEDREATLKQHRICSSK